MLHWLVLAFSSFLVLTGHTPYLYYCHLDIIVIIIDTSESIFIEKNQSLFLLVKYNNLAPAHLTSSNWAFWSKQLFYFFLLYISYLLRRWYFLYHFHCVINLVTTLKFPGLSAYRFLFYTLLPILELLILMHFSAYWTKRALANSPLGYICYCLHCYFQP